MMAALLKLQGKRKYFLISNYLTQIYTSSTTATGTAKQLVELSSIVGTQRGILLNFSKSPSGKLHINF